MSRSCLRVAGLALLLCLASSSPLRAEPGRKLHIGPEIGWGDDRDFTVGGRVIWSVNEWLRGFELSAAYNHFFPSSSDEVDHNYYELNFNLGYNFGQGALVPYLATGLNVASLKTEIERTGVSDSETDIGVNLVAGLKFGEAIGSGLVPFVEVRYEIDGGEQFVLMGGLIF